MTAQPITQRDQEAEIALESERFVLCSSMISREDLNLAGSYLEARIFSDARHRVIFTALLRLRDLHAEPSPLSVLSQLQAHGDLPAAGGREAVTAIMEYAGARENLPGRIQAVRRAYALRETRRLALEIAGGAEADSLIERMEALKSYAEPLEGAAPLEGQIMDSRQLLDAHLEPIESLIGRGLIIKGGLSLIVGQSGLGKTYLALQIMRSLATGTEWLGFHCKMARSCLVELEMPAASIRDRIRAGVSDEDALRRMDWLVMPIGMGPITHNKTADEISRLIEKRKIEFLAFDPLHSIHKGDEKESEDIDAVLSSLLTICRRTACSIALIHHVNKIPIDDKSGLKSAVQIAARGSGRLVNDPDTVLGLIERHGRTELVFAKIRHGSPLDEVAIKQMENGFFELTDTPEQVRDHSLEKIEKALHFVGSKGALIEDLMSLTELSRKTILTHLERMDIARIKEPGRGGRTRYFKRDAIMEQGEAEF